MSDEPSKSVLLSSAGTSVTVQENTVTSKRSGTVTFVQYESGKPGYVSCNQAEGIQSIEYSISVYPTHYEWEYNDISTYVYVNVTALKMIKVNGTTISWSDTPIDYKEDSNFSRWFHFESGTRRIITDTPNLESSYRDAIVTLYCTESPNTIVKFYCKQYGRT